MINVIIDIITIITIITITLLLYYFITNTCVIMKKQYYIYFLILCLSIIHYIGIFLAPFLFNSNPTLSGFIYSIYAFECHQLPYRSFFVFGHQMSVCARCFGIYTGWLVGLIIYPFVWKVTNYKTPNKWYLIIALLPMAIDGTTQLIGLRESFNELRLFTGLLAGFVGVFYIVPVFIKTLLEIKEYFSKNRN